MCAMHGPAFRRFVSISSSKIHLTRAVAREYVYATDEHGTKTPHVLGCVRAYSPMIEDVLS
jgi:hypothetical protein